MSSDLGQGQGRRRALALGATFAVGAAAGVGAFAGLSDNSSPSPRASLAIGRAMVPGAVARTTAHYDAVTLFKRDSPGVVDIKVNARAPQSANGLFPFLPDRGTVQAGGSGFVYDKSGDIVTAAHVVADASKITVTFASGKTAVAKLVGSDPSSDTAVIKVDVPSTDLAPLTLGDSGAVEPGQGVVAIGSPYGYAETITAGIVSGIGRDIEAGNGFTIPNAIQTDAAINHGNSGGPLIDENGDVIGINDQIESGSGDNSGVGFAVPSNMVRTVVADLIAGKAISHPYLGISVAASTSVSGARVGGVKAGSPAATADLKIGDVITALDGAVVTNPDQLIGMIGQHKPGDKIRLTVDRNGTKVTVDATLGMRPATASA